MGHEHGDPDVERIGDVEEIHPHDEHADPEKVKDTDLKEVKA